LKMKSCATLCLMMIVCRFFSLTEEVPAPNL
jgi:hypothetical protein